MRKISTGSWNVVLLWMLVFASACQAENTNTPTAEPQKTKIDNSAFQAYVPEGWKLQNDRILDIDIDGDGYKDAILTLIEDERLNKGDLPDFNNERAVLVLLGDKNGKYRVLTFAKNALLCGSCAGMMGSFGNKEPGEVFYESNTFNISWMAGSRDAVFTDLSFRFDRNKNQFVLVSENVERRDRVVGVSKITKRDFVAGTQTVDGKTTSIEKKVMPLEAVKYYDYLK